ncbi:MAG: hypothetical protein R3C58_07785 [Parvularculaceae bacterium]
MTKSLRSIVESASWQRVAISFALLFAYSFWAFTTNTPWTRALKAADGALPETQPGFPPIEPQRSLDMLGGATGDYLAWQLLDIPYALLTAAFATSAIALGLKVLRLGVSQLRYLLLLPCVYLGCEAIENALVAGFAAGIIPVRESIVLVQQFTTSAKFATGIPASLLGVLFVVLALGAMLVRMGRKRA